MSPGGPLARPDSNPRLGRKGQVDQGVGTDAGPSLPLVGRPNAQFQQADPAAVVSSPKGPVRREHGGRGTPPAMPGDQPLTGHHFGPLDARGNNPVRSPGKKTPPTTIDKGMD